jgi:putative ABC transport system permease protein
MFRNYFTTGWRNLIRNKAYSIINIGGLAIGMAVAILNGLWMWDELSFNKYYENYDRIAQVAITDIEGGEKRVGTTQTYPLGTELITNHHRHFKHIVRTSFPQEFIVSTSDKKLPRAAMFADSTFPELFTFKMVRGSRSALSDTHSTMISATLAKTLFGDADPINQILRLNNKTEVTVTGVFEDFPLNTKFHDVKFFLSWNLLLVNNPWIEERALTDWRNHFIHIYVEILPTTSFEAVSDQIKKVIRYDPLDAEKFTKADRQIHLYPMSRWHLFPLSRGVVESGPVQMVWIVGSIGIFVLLLACINFMNLCTARSEKRAKEVGIRKTMGSARRQLIYQFYSESFMVVCVAFIVALALVNLTLPWFNDLAAKQITMPWSSLRFWAIDAGFILITSLLAGSYPALFLSSFQPVRVLKGLFRAGRFASAPRKVLVVLQFTISVSLIISTIIIFRQVQFAKNRPVGYTREGLISMHMKTDEFYGNTEVLRNELKNTNAVEEVSLSQGPVTEVWSGNNGFEWRGKDPTNKDESFGTLTVSYEHGKTIGWQFIQGRDFSREFASDSSGMVINEAAAKYMGFQNAVGELVTWNWWRRDRDPLHYKIIGVVKDMVMDSPYDPVIPTVFYLKGHNGGVSCINIKMNPNLGIHEALSQIEAVFRKIIPGAPFEYKFVDDEYALKFADEERLGKLTSFFGILAILISCLGLFGLAAFVAEQRTKEIGVRKILGATLMNLWQLLSKEFVLLIIISCTIAIPISFLLMGNWLESYVYRTELSAWIFVVAAVSAFFITLLIVGFQTLKAATTNPVDSLRAE